MVGLAIGFGLGDTLSDLLVSGLCRLRGAKPPGLERSKGLVTPASLLFAPTFQNKIKRYLIFLKVD